MATEPGSFMPAGASRERGASLVIGDSVDAMPRVGKRGAPQAFARKLFEILTIESNSVIAWNKEGTAFHVKDVEGFSEDILTKYYRHSKFSSFQRQLNLYSFRKIVKGPDAGGYNHPMFRRDRPDDLYHVRRSISGSARYEPAAHLTSAAKTTTSAAMRKAAGRASSKANSGSDWVTPRAHKSCGAARRVGKLRVSTPPAHARRTDQQLSRQQQYSAATATEEVASSRGERSSSALTSGESSDSDASVAEANLAASSPRHVRETELLLLLSANEESESDDLSEGEGAGKEKEEEASCSKDTLNNEVAEGQRRQTASIANNIGNRRNILVGRDAAAGERDHQQQQQQHQQQQQLQQSRQQQQYSPNVSINSDDVSSLGRQQQQQQQQQQLPLPGPTFRDAVSEDNSSDAAGVNLEEPRQSSTSPPRKSPFNFFKKTFSFMERSTSSSSRHSRGTSTSSVDMNLASPASPPPPAGAPPLMVDTSAEARAAAAGLLSTNSNRPPPVSLVSSGNPGGRLLLSPILASFLKAEPLAAAGGKVLESSSLTPGSSSREDAAAVTAEAAGIGADAAAAMPPPVVKREQREELGLVEQLTNMVEVFDICDLLRKVSTSNSSRLDRHGGIVKSAHQSHLRNMSVDTDQGLPQSPGQMGDGEDGEQFGLGSLASMELVRDSSKDWDTLMAGSADVSDLGNTMVQSVAEFFSF